MILNVILFDVINMDILLIFEKLLFIWKDEYVNKKFYILYEFKC